MAEAFPVPTWDWDGRSGMDALVSGRLAFTDTGCTLLVTGQGETVPATAVFFPNAFGVRYEGEVRGVVDGDGRVLAVEGEEFAHGGDGALIEGTVAFLEDCPVIDAGGFVTGLMVMDGEPIAYGGGYGPPDAGVCHHGPMEHADLELPEPDTKDWTWTVRHRCPECGVAVGDLTLRQVADLTDLAARQWVELLEGDDVAALRRRPHPRVWSTTEYAAHVRDVGRVFLTRLDLILAEDTPTFANWDQDAAALEGGYADLDPRHVAPGIATSLGAFAARLRGVPLGDELRRGHRSNGSEFTALTLAQYFLHDVVHHLQDVGRPLKV